MNFAHIGFAVNDLGQSKNFYKEALAPLGLAVLSEGDSYFSIGDSKAEKNLLWVHTTGSPAGSLHICFEGTSKEQVDEFYKAGLAAGGRDNGAPGIRANYSPNYYAAFVLDPDGHNIEVVFRK